MKPFQMTTIYILLYSYVIVIIFLSQVRPVRDSMIDAVQLWKKLSGEDGNGNVCLFVYYQLYYIIEGFTISYLM